jgi:formylglycine-generating enzyme required for sulfatase activity
MIHVRKPLSALKVAVLNRRLVLLGAPGSGKSTFINYLAFCLTQHQLDPEGNWIARLADHQVSWPKDEIDILPVIVTLRDFVRWAREHNQTEGHAGALGDFLTQWLTNRDLTDFADSLRKALHEGKAIIFFDGLDEISTRAQRLLVRDAIADFAYTYQESRIIVTCRILSYQEKSQRLPADMFSVFELAPFTSDKIFQFIDAWYRELSSLGTVSLGEANILARKLKEAVERSDIWRMASNPLLLTVMALVHAYRGRLPEARALLYEECTDLLLWRWEEVKVQGQAGRASGLRRLLQEAELQDVDFKRALWGLAFTAHAQGFRGNDGGTADIAETDLLRALRELHPGRSWDWAAAVVRQIKERAGLLIEREPEIYAFPHRTFQEYLAACHLSVQVDFARQAVALSDEATLWREVVLLAIGRQVHVSGNLAQPLILVAELCPDQCGPEEIGWPRAWLAGEILKEAGKRRVQQQGALGRELLKRVQTRLTRLVEEGHLVARERAEVGDVLSRLDDPRPGVGISVVENIEVPDILWIEIPEGFFMMGSTDETPDAYPDEKPQHELMLPTYYIARYPVTNAQFRPFVEGDGYENPAYWTEQGWAWRQGAEPDLSSLDDVQDKKWKQRYRAWLTNRPVEKRNRPFWSEDPRKGAPTRPVVGITWFEAVAYTQWLQHRLQVAGAKLQVWREGDIQTLSLRPETFKVQLPSEAEWEKAARGTDGRRYPWGDTWQEDHGNIKETEIEETNVVGCFAQGASPYGILEMSGNVWEWTRSCWGERSVLQPDRGYPYEITDGRERLEDMKIPALRGGSWNVDRRNARCACRYGGIPGGFSDDSGFRVLITLISF